MQMKMAKAHGGETHIKIAKHRNGSLENIKLRALLHIQKFEEWDGDTGNSFPSGGNWKPVNTPPPASSGGDNNARLFIQKGSKMNEFDEGYGEEENPF